ncbi:alkaline phosphatase family protein [Pengzhenrongella sicca]|uniref:Alkaline phosphatase family protein n=1 Tax=Pengzhenrongella sicca TaxID=2819238 RepID=A0A8A4ZM12_9MICO|nr:alkaline phosphatase family protein [Pengzhenrongella sicca]QTE30608.1 alkaline phosphatase family protein [Pengzhenrongella sicca]
MTATATRAPWWGPTLRDLGEGAVAVVTSALGLGVALLLLDDAGARSWLDVLAVAVLMTLGDRLVRPLVRLVAAALGVLGALLAGLAAQVLVAWAALTVVPGITVRSWGQVLLLLLIAAGAMTAGRWLLGANDGSYVLGDVLRRARSRARHGEVPGRGEPGLLVVQLDGVARAVFENAVEAGLVPTMARWLQSGTHRLDGWWARVPSTTPASQAALLHGASAQVPAFRWWDKDLGRLVVTNRPADAALVEARVSDGDGLLAHGGAAISTMFTGDAPIALLVMSRARGRRGFGPGTAFIRFFASPYVLTRTLGLTAGEMVKELYQGRRQRARDVQPRVRRRGVFVALRGLSNVLLRDLNTALVAEQLLHGTPTVFVDLVDYDEIAHHAGPVRPESLRALEGLDRVLEILAEVADHAPRAYRTVVLSDHGQSLGATFAQVEGEALVDVVRALMLDVAAAPGPGVTAGVTATAAAARADAGEEWGPLYSLLGSTGAVRLTEAEPDRGEHPEVAVIASGNLGLVWFPRLPGTVTLEEVLVRWPRLVPGLLARAGVGVVVAHTRDRGPIALGVHGARLLADDAPVPAAEDGDDPLAPYGPRARPDLLRAAGLAHAGDLLLVSSVDERGSVHAFEELVGSHGGLGGAQNDALLLYPADWAIDPTLRQDVAGSPTLVGGEGVHAQLVQWQRTLGLRP